MNKKNSLKEIFAPTFWKVAFLVVVLLLLLIVWAFVVPLIDPSNACKLNGGTYIQIPLIESYCVNQVGAFWFYFLMTFSHIGFFFVVYAITSLIAHIFSEGGNL